HPVLRAGRDVGAVGVEAAVAADAAGDQRRLVVVRGEELGLVVGELHGVPSPWVDGKCKLLRIQPQADVPGATRTLLSRPERQAQLRRAAATAFARTGFAGTSMEDVARQAGVSRLIVY